VLPGGLMTIINISLGSRDFQSSTDKYLCKEKKFRGDAGTAPKDSKLLGRFKHRPPTPYFTPKWP